MTLPLGASVQRTQAVADAFSKQLRAQPEVEDMFAITGLNLLTGTNSPYAATFFVELKPWAERRGEEHGAPALAARLNRIGAGIKEANVLMFNPPPIPGIGTAGGFEFILEDRSGGDIQKFAGVLGDFFGAGEQASGARARVHAVQYAHAANRIRAGSRARQDPGSVDLQHLRQSADVFRRQLHQRLQSVRPNLQGDRAG